MEKMKLEHSFACIYVRQDCAPWLFVCAHKHKNPKCSSCGFGTS
jgi:hypothetical protein